MTADQRIDDFIAEHRERLTREAITEQLEAAGYARADVEAAWERAALAAPPKGEVSGTMATYVWIVYWLGAALIAAYGLLTTFAGGGGVGVLPFAIGWLLLYLVLAYLPARALARTRSSNLAVIVAVVVATPVIVVVIGGGICAATLAILLGSMGY